MGRRPLCVTAMLRSTRTTCFPRCTTNSTTPSKLPFTTVWCVCVPRRLAATVLLLLASSQQLLLPVVLEPLVPLPLVLHLPLLPLPKQFRFCGNLSRVFALLVSLLSGSCRECCAPISVNDFA